MSKGDPFDLARDVVGTLESQDIRVVLIGAVALAQYRVARATFDVDLMVMDPRVFQVEWASHLKIPAEIEARKGDPFDAVGGVVRFAAQGQQRVDLIVGKWDWMRSVIDNAHPLEFMGLTVRAATRVDLVRLKLDAGGPRDAWDIQALLDADETGSLESEVSDSLDELSPSAKALWAEILTRRQSRE